MRVLALACPDWPVVAASWEQPMDRRLPVAVLTNNRVTACNDSARGEGIRTQMRRRDAQSKCPELVLIPADPQRDVRAFEAVLSAVEALRPGVAPIRPGLLAVKSPGRFYGGDENAAAVLTETVVEVGVWDARVGVADDVSTAVQAAYETSEQGWLVIPEGATADFWKTLPVEALFASGSPEEAEEIAEFVGLLRRLGMRTLGQFAALKSSEVLVRFGRRGARLHRLIRGEATGGIDSRKPPPDLDVVIDFEPPLESIEAVGFSARQSADTFVGQLGERGFVCTSVTIEAETDRGTRTARTWRHATWFSATDLIDRLHWQMAAAAQARTIDASISRVVFIPEAVDAASAHADALWGHGNNERIERGIAKVQALLGYEAARRPVLQGGRSPADRQALVPWGEQATLLRSPTLPWPGSIPPPAPCRVFTQPHPSDVLDERHQRIRVDARGAISGVPARFLTPQGWEHVDGWAGPWPVEEAWWEDEPRRIARFQMISTAGRAWLLRYENGDWLTEAGYD
ncbi:MAG: DNA polymerase Y family protein [Marmoricola sp.]